MKNLNDKSDETNYAIDKEGLNTIKQNTDWRMVFSALGLNRVNGKGNDHDWWASSPLSEDATASFHISDDPATGEGRWFCFSNNMGGSIPDLIQAINGGTIYEAAQWLLDHNCSSLTNPPPLPSSKKTSGSEKAKSREKKNEEAKAPAYNKPIRQSLLHAMTEKGAHPSFTEKGISESTCDYLGCGYLPESHAGKLSNRIVFQIRGLDNLESPTPKQTILSHIGRATQEAPDVDKWYHYAGFKKTLELYNIDQLLLDPQAVEQIEQTHKIWLVEGCFDVAKLIEADIKNVVACFGGHLAAAQIEKLQALSARFPKAHFGVWFDRDKAGLNGQTKALETLQASELKNIGFDWNQAFTGSDGLITLPQDLNDPADFSVTQLQWMRRKGIL